MSVRAERVAYASNTKPGTRHVSLQPLSPSLNVFELIVDFFVERWRCHQFLPSASTLSWQMAATLSHTVRWLSSVIALLTP